MSLVKRETPIDSYLKGFPKGRLMQPFISHLSFARQATQMLGQSNHRNLFWACREEMNFGDYIGPYLFQKITGSSPVYCPANRRTLARTYFTVGSILHHIRVARSVTVWGSGVISADSLYAEPLKTCAVRGPYTRRRHLALGYSCPPIFGDPALLMPRYFDAPVDVKFSVGIVPHFVDFESVKARYSHSEINVIDVCDSVEAVITNIRKCNVIISSSLHGMILAHAYGIQSAYIQYADRLKGDGVKFQDYLEGVDSSFQAETFRLDSEDSLAVQIEKTSALPLPDITEVQEALLDSCPF